MLKKRVIAVFLLKDDLLVQSYYFNRHLPIGKPEFELQFVSRWNIDEVVLLDISAAKRSSMIDSSLVAKLSDFCRVPLTVGGGIHSLTQAKLLFDNGADKISLNSSLFQSKGLLEEITRVYGSQAVVAVVDFKFIDNEYYVFKYDGNINTGVKLIDWVIELESRGVGEIILQSIDKDGSGLGYDLNAINVCSELLKIPLIALGGVGQPCHFIDGFRSGASAVAAGNYFHHLEHSVLIAKSHLSRAGMDVRISKSLNYSGSGFDSNGRLKLKDEIL